MRNLKVYTVGNSTDRRMNGNFINDISSSSLILNSSQLFSAFGIISYEVTFDETSAVKDFSCSNLKSAP